MSAVLKEDFIQKIYESTNGRKIVIDESRDSKLTEFGKATLLERYVTPGESFQELFARVACAYSDSNEHAQRTYDYISNLWFMPATPVLSNGGTDRGLPISCFLNEVPDSMRGIADVWNENIWLASKGGGIGTYWGGVRSIGEKVKSNGFTSGIIPFIGVMDRLTLAISQGCVDGSTEILTEKGWIKFAELNASHGRVMQVDSNRRMSFVDVQEYHRYPYSGPMHHYKNSKGSLDHFVTPNHRMAYQSLLRSKDDRSRSWNTVLKIRESSEFLPHRDNRLIVTGIYNGGDLKALSPKERFLIAYQADGSTKPSGTSNGNKSGELCYAFRFRRARKIERMRELLSHTGYRYSENSYENGTTSFLVNVPLAETPSKKLSDWVKLDQISASWCREFIEEMKYWDGTTNDLDTIRWDGVGKDNADMICAIASMAGYKAFSDIQDRPAPRANLDKVHICTARSTIGGECIDKTIVEDWTGDVYCVSVPSGMFLARRNGRVLVTGNSLRRGSAAVYLPVWHPEIEEFLEIRKPSGDFNRKALNLHHAVVIDDNFMHAVANEEEYALVSPKTGEVRKKIDARQLFQKLLDMRIQTGEPYFLFSDTVNRGLSDFQKKLGLTVKTSNLCNEITLSTGADHLGNERTAVCCLSSLNLETFDEWGDNEQIVEDCLRFLDNVIDDFIKRAEPDMKNAVYSATRERAVGLGVMGFHSYLQSKRIPFESAQAKELNLKMFQKIKKEADAASVKLAYEKGPCLDAADAGVMERFSHKIAIAPTASISIICGGTSPGIEPIAANSFNHKTLSGSMTVRNIYLQKILAEKGLDTVDTWQSIVENQGSVSHMAELSEEEKAVFKTAFELDQRWVIEHAADRAQYICQGQSLNLFLKADIDKWDLLMLHWQAWEKGVKGLYYCRSKSIQRAAFAGSDVSGDNSRDLPKLMVENKTDYEECLACS